MKVGVGFLAASLAALLLAAQALAWNDTTFRHSHLACNDPGLKDGTLDVLRIEITQAASAPGTRGDPERLGFKVIEALRTMESDMPTTAYWLGFDTPSAPGSTYGDWAAQTLDAAPPAGARGLAIGQFSGNDFGGLRGDEFFPDTPENRSTASRCAVAKRWVRGMEGPMFYAVMLLPILGLCASIARPVAGIVVAALTFPVYFLYDAQVSTSAMRVDVLFTYPALTVAALVVAGSVIRLMRTPG